MLDRRRSRSGQRPPSFLDFARAMLSKYEDLKRSTGITHSTLSGRLKHLEQNGLIERRVYQTRPARHQYVPSAKGWDMVLVIQALAHVSDKWGVASSDRPPLEFVNAHGGAG